MPRQVKWTVTRVDARVDRIKVYIESEWHEGVGKVWQGRFVHNDEPVGDPESSLSRAKASTEREVMAYARHLRLTRLR